VCLFFPSFDLFNVLIAELAGHHPDGVQPIWFLVRTVSLVPGQILHFGSLIAPSVQIAAVVLDGLDHVEEDGADVDERGIRDVTVGAA